MGLGMVSGLGLSTSPPTLGVIPFVNTLSTNFDGVDEYINCGSDSSLDITGAISLSLWIKSSSLVGDDGGLISKSEDAGKYFGSTSNKVYELAILNNVLYLQLSTGLAKTNINTSSLSLIDGAWHQIVATFDGTTDANGLKIYFDGIQEAQATSTISSIQTKASSLDIGGWTTTFNYSGNIDEVSIWNKGLSAAEVTAQYNSGSPTDLSGLAGLVGWWGMDAFPTVLDKSANSNDGTLVNMIAGNIVEDTP